MKAGRGKVAVLRGRQRSTRAQPLSKRLALSRVFVLKAREVTAYLKQYPRLDRLLPTVCAQVRKALGNNVELSLEIYSDPEIDDRYLTLYVRHSRYDASLIKRIEALREETNPQLEAVPGYLLLMTDFRLPRTRHAV
jgi:hypothetical protein